MFLYAPPCLHNQITLITVLEAPSATAEKTAFNPLYCETVLSLFDNEQNREHKGLRADGKWQTG